MQGTEKEDKMIIITETNSPNKSNSRVILKNVLADDNNYSQITTGTLLFLKIIECKCTLVNDVARINIYVYFPLFFKKTMKKIINHLFKKVNKIEIKLISSEDYFLRNFKKIGFFPELIFKDIFLYKGKSYDYYILSKFK